MKSIVDVIRAVSGVVETLFGEPPTDRDIHQGFTRPCSYVQVTGLQSESAGQLLRHDRAQLEIIRLATYKPTGYLELLQWQEVLRERLEEPIAVDSDFYLYPEDVDFSLRDEDRALVVSFALDIVQQREDTDESQLMDGLSITQ